jgi:1,4-dihydroxy-2-naphthoate octaprenyltransferase
MGLGLPERPGKPTRSAALDGATTSGEEQGPAGSSSLLARAMALVRLGRPHFLVGGFLLYGLGALVARWQGARFDAAAYGLGQATITAFQLMTHYANDYFDLGADLANATPTRFSGGSRVLPGGLLPAKVALVAALVLGVGGVGLTVASTLVAHAGAAGGAAPAWVAGAVLLLAGALAWAYSAPPFALHSRGWGELTTAVVVTGLTPFAGYILQSPELGEPAGTMSRMAALGRVVWDGPLLATLLPLALLQFNMLLTIELPDAAGDAVVDKRTLVVRFGARRAARGSQVILGAAYGLLPVLTWWRLPAPAAIAMAATAPVAAWQIWRIGRGDWARPERWGSLCLRAVALLVLTAGCALVAFAALVTLPASPARTASPAPATSAAPTASAARSAGAALPRPPPCGA